MFQELLQNLAHVLIALSAFPIVWWRNKK